MGLPSEPQRRTGQAVVENMRAQVLARADRPVDATARRRVERQLRHHYKTGALEMDEFERRLDIALTATSTLELRRASSGLRSIEPQVHTLRAKIAGLTMAMGAATVTWISTLAGSAILWAVLETGAVVTGIVAGAVTAIYGYAMWPLRRARRRLRGELADVRQLSP